MKQSDTEMQTMSRDIARVETWRQFGGQRALRPGVVGSDPFGILQ